MLKCWTYSCLAHQVTVMQGGGGERTKYNPCFSFFALACVLPVSDRKSNLRSKTLGMKSVISPTLESLLPTTTVQPTITDVPPWDFQLKWKSVWHNSESMDLKPFFCVTFHLETLQGSNWLPREANNTYALYLVQSISLLLIFSLICQRALR